MKMKHFVSSMILFFVTLTLFAMPAHSAGINVSAAASLKEVVTELTDTFVRQNPGIVFQNNFGGSGALAKQIENGAPADLFLSANLEWMDYLKEKKMIDELKVRKLRDVVKLEKIAIGSPKSVPAGQYAMDALKKEGMDKQLENKLVMARDVRECLLYADRGEVDGAFVYKTDAEQMAKNVQILFAVPRDLYPRVTYPMAITKEGSHKAEAAGFFKFLRSGAAKAVLAKYGFAVK